MMKLMLLPGILSSYALAQTINVAELPLDPDGFPIWPETQSIIKGDLIIRERADIKSRFSLRSAAMHKPVARAVRRIALGFSRQCTRTLNRQQSPWSAAERWPYRV